MDAITIKKVEEKVIIEIDSNIFKTSTKKAVLRVIEKKLSEFKN